MTLILGLIGMLLIVIPMWKITERAGLSPYWAIACIVPLGLIVLLWVIAYRTEA
ncbi:MAG: hypothetical protein U1E34_12050 [Amaricoccus sp.]